MNHVAVFKTLLFIFILPAGIYLFKLNNGNIRTMCKICLKLTIETLEQHIWCRFGFFSHQEKVASKTASIGFVRLGMLSEWKHRLFQKYLKRLYIILLKKCKQLVSIMMKYLHWLPLIYIIISYSAIAKKILLEITKTYWGDRGVQ